MDVFGPKISKRTFLVNIQWSIIISFSHIQEQQIHVCNKHKLYKNCNWAKMSIVLAQIPIEVVTNHILPLSIDKIAQAHAWMHAYV
jgi:hypothetical protein